jgi:hypothetical protein
VNFWWREVRSRIGSTVNGLLRSEAVALLLIIANLGIDMQVADDVHNLCSKCGVVAHVVVALVEGRVVKVECKECGSRHRFRDAAGQQAKVTRSPSRSRSTRAKNQQPSVEPDLSRPIRPYRASDSYAAGDRIDHQSFGMGVIERVMGPSKVEVYFSEGRKTLLQGRTL